MPRCNGNNFKIIMNKGAFRNFIPDYQFNNIDNISVDFFFGSQFIIFDLDNTLVFRKFDSFFS